MTDYLWLLVPLLLILAVIISIIRGGSAQQLPLNSNAQEDRRQFLKFAGLTAAATVLPKSEERFEVPKARKKNWYDPRTWRTPPIGANAGKGMTTCGPNTAIGYTALQRVAGDDCAIGEGNGDQ